MLKGPEKIFNKSIENFPRLKMEMPIKIQEAYRMLSRLAQERKSSHHIIFKTINLQNKEWIFKAVKEEYQVTCKGRLIKIVHEFSMETLKVSRT